eukprot:664212-Pleurochrysis_carterae.AAC.1
MLLYLEWSSGRRSRHDTHTGSKLEFSRQLNLIRFSRKQGRSTTINSQYTHNRLGPLFKSSVDTAAEAGYAAPHITKSQPPKDVTGIIELTRQSDLPACPNHSNGKQQIEIIRNAHGMRTPMAMDNKAVVADVDHIVIHASFAQSPLCAAAPPG